jgi:hypothetical protein
MKVAAAGFWDYDKLDRTLNQLIEEKQFFIFTVLVGGTRKGEPSIGERWARNNGAPLEYCYCSDVELLLEKIAKNADYVIADLSGGQWVKRLVMKMKGLGKHGTVV